MFPRFTFSDQDNMEKLFKQFRKFPKKCQQNIFFYFVLDFLDLATFQSPLFGKLTEKLIQPRTQLETSGKNIFPPLGTNFSSLSLAELRLAQCLGLEKYEIAIIYYTVNFFPVMSTGNPCVPILPCNLHVYITGIPCILQSL